MNAKEYENRTGEVVDQLREELSSGVGGPRAGRLAEQARRQVRRIIKEARRAVDAKGLGRDRHMRYIHLPDEARQTLLGQLESIEAMCLSQIDQALGG